MGPRGSPTKVDRRPRAHSADRSTHLRWKIPPPSVENGPLLMRDICWENRSELHAIDITVAHLDRLPSVSISSLRGGGQYSQSFHNQSFQRLSAHARDQCLIIIQISANAMDAGECHS